MHLNWLIIPTFCGALVLFVLGQRVAAAVQPQHGIAWLVLGAALALPGMLLVAYYGHVLDSAVWFYSFRAAPYTELTAAGAGFAAGLAAGGLRRVPFVAASTLLKPLTPGLVLGCLGLLVGVPYVKPLVAP